MTQIYSMLEIVYKLFFKQVIHSRFKMQRHSIQSGLPPSPVSQPPASTSPFPRGNHCAVYCASFWKYFMQIKACVYISLAISFPLWKQMYNIYSALHFFSLNNISWSSVYFSTQSASSSSFRDNQYSVRDMPQLIQPVPHYWTLKLSLAFLSQTMLQSIILHVGQSFCRINFQKQDKGHIHSQF